LTQNQPERCRYVGNERTWQFSESESPAGEEQHAQDQAAQEVRGEVLRVELSEGQNLAVEIRN